MIVKHTRVMKEEMELGYTCEHTIGAYIDQMLSSAGPDIITSVTVEITDEDRTRLANASQSRGKAR